MINRGGWKIKKTIVGYQTPWVTVVEDHGARPDGKPGMHVRVELPDGISVLPIDGDGFVYLIKEFHYGEGRELIEVVSGRMDGNERPLAAAKRELKEELGLLAKRWISLGRVNPHTSITTASAYLFLARGLLFGPHAREGTERIHLMRMKLAEAVRLVMRGSIVHAPSALLILKAHEYLKSKSRGSMV